MTPRVTVAIPTYNRAGLLRESLASALGQTLPDIEVIVSDNGSTDETPEVVAYFDDPRLRYERLDQNVGPHGNLSRALVLGSAPYVAILQDDDLMLPENLERKVAALDLHARAVLAHSQFQFVDEEGGVLSEGVDWWKSPADVEYGRDFIRGQLERGVRADMTSWLLRRSALRGLRFDPDEGLAADYGFLLRLALRGDVVYVRRPLTATRRHTASLSVTGRARVLPGGHYAPSFAYALAGRRAAERFLDAHGGELQDSSALRRVSRRWARGELAGVVRTETGEEPRLGPTLRVTRQAAAADPAVLLNRRVVLTVAWAALGETGRRLVRRAVPPLRTRVG